MATRGTTAAKLGHRLSVTLNDEQYEELARMARQKRVSIAWVVRDAVERLIAEEQPLLKMRGARP